MVPVSQVGYDSRMDRQWVVDLVERLPQGVLSRGWGWIARRRHPRLGVEILKRVFVKAAGIDIPLPTQIAIWMYTALSSYWWLLLLVTGSTITALYLYLKTENGKFVRDTILMNTPLIGPLFVKSAMSRFASIFSILQSSGVAVLDIIAILSGTIGNFAIGREFSVISRGQSFIDLPFAQRVPF